MMKSILFLFLGIVLLTLAVSATADITPNDRLLQRPERDGAVVQRSWARCSAMGNNDQRSLHLLNKISRLMCPHLF
jgi:hypothetical protein